MTLPPTIVRAILERWRRLAAARPAARVAFLWDKVQREVRRRLKV